METVEGVPELLKNASSLLEVDCSRRFEYVAESKMSGTLEELWEGLEVGGSLEELGYGSSTDAARSKEVLGLFNPLTEKDVAVIIGSVARSHLGLEDVHGTYTTLHSILGLHGSDSACPTMWNQDALVEAIKELVPSLDSLSVAENLDHEGFFVPDQKAISILMSLYTRICRDPFPVHAVCGIIWRNTEGQLSFLKHAALAPPDVFLFANSPRKQILTESYQKFMHGSPNHAWLSVDLLESLCGLAECGHFESVRSLLEYPAKHCPELLLSGLAQVKTNWNLIQNSFFTTLLSAYVGVNAHGTLVTHQLWDLNREAVKRAMVEIHAKDLSLITPILNLCQEKLLTPMLEDTPFRFSLDLAALASRREFLCLEKWLANHLATHKDVFFQACLNFLREKLQVEGSSNRNGPVALLSETTATILKALQSVSAQISSRDLTDEMKRIQTVACRLNPRLLGAGTEQSSGEAFSSKVEEEANGYFQKIYMEQVTISEVVEMLAKFNVSPIPRERELFSCMIQSLFDEYRFFHRYPDKELRITAVLFGKLISHQLVSSITLGVALRYVLDALRKPPDSRMFSFGMTALEQFKSRLEELPQYCNHILQISHMREGHPELVEYIERSLVRSSAAQTDNSTNAGAAESLPAHEQVSDGNPIQNANPQVLPQQDERPRSASSTLGLTRTLTSYDVLKAQKVAQNTQAVSQNFPKPSRTSSVPVRSQTPGFGAALNIETLVAAAEKRDPVEHPGLETEDKVFFIINNISLANLESKAKECLEVVREMHHPWFAQYMVMKRASIEPNFHDLYLKFLDKMNSKALNQEIINATYQNCKALLRSELIKSSSEERSLLKNLGSWLGKLTIGRNRVLKAKEIDLKALITEAYERGLMIAVIPFTSKIMEPCSSSLVYHPPNPWTMGVLSLLAEIYALPNLKMNLKFDIEVLFKNLGVDMKDVKPSQLLKNRTREIEGNPDFSKVDLTLTHQPPATEHTSLISSLNQVDFLPELPVATSHAAVSHPSSSPQLTVQVPPTNQDDDKTVSFAAERLSKGLSSIQSQYSSSSAQSSASYLNAYMVLNPRLASGISQQLQIQLHRIVPAAMERAIREIIAPVVDRSVTIAVMTSRELIMKDFALEADDSRTLQAANLMVASLAGSLAHVTCKEPLRVAMASHIRNSLQANLATDLLEQAVQLVTSDNLDLGCAVIEKAATEKALRELEETMTPLLLSKRSSRESLIQAYTQGALSRLPEALRPKPGRLSPNQQRVFEDFARLPWQNQTASNTNATSMSRANNYSPFAAAPTVPHTADGGSDDLDVRAPSPTSFSEIGSRLQDVPSEGGALTDGASSELLVPNVLSTPTEPSILPAVQDGNNELYNVINALGKVSQRSGSIDSLQHLAEIAKNSSLIPSSVKDEKTELMKDKKQITRVTKDDIKPRDTDPVGLREQVVVLFDEWARVCSSPGPNERIHSFVSQVSQAALLKGDEVTDRFFRILTELAVDHSLSVDPQSGLIYAAIDSYAKLVVNLVKYNAGDPAMNRVGLLNRVLTVTVRVIQKDADEKKALFQPRPYFRLFFTWLVDFNASDPTLESNNSQFLLAFTNAFLMLQPLNVPGWSFVWLELISHRMFMPKQLLSPSQKGWPHFQRLLVALFKFMDPYLRSADLSDPIRLLYKGTLRVLLVLLHDFPEFLCDYHFSFCDVIPPSCIQMRNLILSAFPRNMRLPDPFTPNLKVDLLPEISQPPRILSEVDLALKNKQLKGEVDEYLKTRQSLSLFLGDLKQRLMLPQHEAVTSGTRYNVPLINSLVLYVGMQAIQQLQSKTTPQQLAVPTAPITHSAPMDIFQKLIIELDTEGRYLFLNAIANQLRYPNNHTHYFSCVLLYLFAEANQEIIQEQITRVLLERLIVNRPHPWGLLITFIELIKNPRYSFWTHAFTRCAPEIERLFDSVARSCMGPPVKPTDDELPSALNSESIKV